MKSEAAQQAFWVLQTAERGIAFGGGFIVSYIPNTIAFKNTKSHVF